jgi:hypothetical protein
MFRTALSLSCKHKHTFPKLVVAILLFLLAVLIFAGGVLAKRSLGSLKITNESSIVMQAASTPTPSGLSSSSPPTSL